MNQQTLLDGKSIKTTISLNRNRRKHWLILLLLRCFLRKFLICNSLLLLFDLKLLRQVLKINQFLNICFSKWRSIRSSLNFLQRLCLEALHFQSKLMIITRHNQVRITQQSNGLRPGILKSMTADQLKIPHLIFFGNTYPIQNLCPIGIKANFHLLLSALNLSLEYLRSTSLQMHSVDQVLYLFIFDLKSD